MTAPTFSLRITEKAGQNIKQLYLPKSIVKTLFASGTVLSDGVTAMVGKTAGALVR